MAMSSDDERAFLAGNTVSVASSNVSGAVYEPEGERLYIIYNNGATYQYLGVSLAEAESFARAGSHGTWIWDHLRQRGSKEGSQKPYIREG